MAAERRSLLRSLLSSLVFLGVIGTTAAAGWALIEHSTTDAPTAVRPQEAALLPRLAVPSPQAAPLVGAVPVLAYGAVDPGEGAEVLDPATFARHLAALDAAGFESVSVRDVRALVSGRSPALPERPMLITVDGTHRSAWTTVDPLLAAHGFTAVAFIDPDLVVDHPTSVRLTWAEVRAMQASGRWTIAMGTHDVLDEDDTRTTPGAIRTRVTDLLTEKAATLDRHLDGHVTDAIAYVASGPFATEAAFQSGAMVRGDVSLVFTSPGNELASAAWPATGVPRLAATGLDHRELVDRIEAAAPRAPRGLDAPPDPDAPPVVVSLSWDDGRGSAYRSLAIQQRHGFEATYFINSDQIGSSAYYLSRGQLDEIRTAGNEIGGHTVGHVNLTEVSSAEARAAICDDRETLVDWYGPAAGDTFAYPFGSNGRVADLVEGCGYRSARITSGLRGPEGCDVCPVAEARVPEDRYAIRAAGSIRVDWTLADLQRLVLRAEEGDGGWVNYVLHGVGSAQDDQYAITPETYDALLAWLADRPNVEVRTIGDVMARADRSAGSRPAG